MAAVTHNCHTAAQQTVLNHSAFAVRCFAKTHVTSSWDSSEEEVWGQWEDSHSVSILVPVIQVQPPVSR